MNLWADLRFGARMLWKRPGMAIAALLTLGAGYRRLQRNSHSHSQRHPHAAPLFRSRPPGSRLRKSAAVSLAAVSFHGPTTKISATATIPLRKSRPTFPRPLHSPSATPQKSFTVPP